MTADVKEARCVGTQMALALLVAHYPDTNVEAITKGMSVDLNDAPIDPKGLFLTRPAPRHAGNQAL